MFSNTISNLMDLDRIFEKTGHHISVTDRPDLNVTSRVLSFTVTPQYRDNVAMVSAAIPALVDRELIAFGAGFSGLKWEIHSSRDLSKLERRGVLMLRGAAHATNRDRHSAQKTISHHCYLLVKFPKPTQLAEEEDEHDSNADGLSETARG